MPGLKKGPWTEDENKILNLYVKSNGTNNWKNCSNLLSGRSIKQCRDHYQNNINPELNRSKWTIKEDFIIFNNYYSKNGKWKDIAELVEGRSASSMKNRFLSTLRRFYNMKHIIDEMKKDENSNCNYDDIFSQIRRII